MKKIMVIKKIMVMAFVALLALPLFSQSAYYEGDGGKGLSIEVVAPKVTGNATDEQKWFPAFAANMIHDDMEKYSAIKMIDGTNIEAQMDIDDRNMNSGLFESSGGMDYQSAENTLFIELTITPASYNLSVRVNKGNTTKASHNKNYSVQDMNSGLALKKATADLLEQLGVKLTQSGKQSLLAVAQSHGSIEAQKLNAQAELAEKNGDNITALTYLVKAKKNDAKLKRTSTAIENLSSKVADGNIGEQVRNQIQLRKDFIKLLDETEAYLASGCPFIAVQSKFGLGQIDYTKETMDVETSWFAAPLPDVYKIVKSIKDSFETMPDHSNWGITNRVKELAYLDGNYYYYFELWADGKLLDSNLSGCYLGSPIGLYSSYSPWYLKFNIPADIDTNKLDLKFKKVVKASSSWEKSTLSEYNSDYAELVLSAKKLLNQKKNLYSDLVLMSEEDFAQGSY